jgi:hypothetical protein
MSLADALVSGDNGQGHVKYGCTLWDSPVATRASPVHCSLLQRRVCCETANGTAAHGASGCRGRMPTDQVRQQHAALQRRCRPHQRLSAPSSTAAAACVRQRCSGRRGAATSVSSCATQQARIEAHELLRQRQPPHPLARAAPPSAGPRSIGANLTPHVHRRLRHRPAAAARDVQQRRAQPPLKPPRGACSPSRTASAAPGLQPHSALRHNLHAWRAAGGAGFTRGRCRSRARRRRVRGLRQTPPSRASACRRTMPPPPPRPPGWGL